MAEQYKSRYHERTDVGNLHVENTIYLWDNMVDISQNFGVGDSQKLKNNVAFEPELALRIAKMIIDRYGDKK